MIASMSFEPTTALMLSLRETDEQGRVRTRRAELQNRRLHHRRRRFQAQARIRRLLA